MKTLLFRTCWLILLAAASATVQAQPLAGREYVVLDPPQPAAAGERIEVIEFFSYGCPVCYAAEPYITRWHMKREAEVEFRRVPTPLPAAWAPFAYAYYALEATGLLERLHWPVFDNHHFDGRRLNNEKNFLDWLSANETDALIVKQALDSPEVRAKVEAARVLLDTYNIRGVPTFVVDGRYVTTARMAGGVAEVMDIVDHLVGLARAERARKQAR
jgi:protein dithiol oxidoreductase (disulfide-forming)